ncbi:MAG: NAD-glutamate dehydrogenase [Novosphingobium sp.]|nr:NAD-glutamate dehydrogenase [Novosphingobium sp.]
MSEKRLVAAVAEQLSASLLAGEEPFTAADLADAARVVLDAAREREPGRPGIVVESVTGPAGKRLTRIAVVNDDMPFLVDSIAATIDAHGLVIDRIVHPRVTVKRRGNGRLAMLRADGGNGAGGTRESIVYVESIRADARTRMRLRSALAGTLEEVRVAVADWPKMQAAMAADADRLAGQAGADTEGAALLRWLKDGMLTQLGHVLRRRDGRWQKPLGICRLGSRVQPSPESFERAFAWFDADRTAGGGRAPLILKSDEISHVHRRVPVDLLLVPVIENGRTVALSVHAGLWTSAALAAPPDQVPCLRAALAGLMERFGFDPRGHDGKALVHALTALPHEVLIACGDEDLVRLATTMMSLIDRPRPRIVLVRSPLDRHLHAFVWLPRDAMSTTLRLQVQAMLTQAANAPLIDWNLEIAASLAMLRFVIDIDDSAPMPDEAALDRQFAALVRGWPAAVEAALAESDAQGRAAVLAARFAEAFPLAYRMNSGAAEAAQDILRLHGLAADGADAAPRRDARFHCPEHCGEGRVHLKLYQRHGALELSDAVPMLENFGFRVAGDMPTMLDDGNLGAIHDFRLDLPRGLAGGDLMARASEVEAAIAAVLNGTAEDDGFNRLITATGLAAHEADWLRAWYRYLRQATLSYGIATAVDALANAPQVTRGLIDLFVARHDPGFAGSRARAGQAAQAAIRDGLAQVSAINDDRLLRHYRALVEAVLRSNAFVLPETGPETALAFKIDSAAVPGLPKPVPWREIFVYSRRVEGIHLRAGPVARGGLRWSDRRDDFRTEILGLMKAQRVKNAVIVPTGAKGGFYPKHLPDPAREREAWLAEGKASYRVFIRSLLAVTDNLVGGKVVHPKGMVIRDGEDAYFVVAADKGTASFSDTANALAAEQDFWLGDAFASGGSKGYDHKEMGITARGAWISVQRHFRERGVDVQAESVRVVGCGDMAGDVFGNGMLQSQAIRLVAAFDHRHVFIDPDPDPAASWAERKRLFGLPRSSWDDYDKSLISRGGGCFPRTLKEIPLSAEARAVLDIDAESADPETLISAILKAPVDLLWFGGIGTYVKAASENNAQVGDPANDALRVNGAQVRAHVVGEGANLGCTQAGRIEYALHANGGAGGRINADFIDNSAGVDSSDNEVNIKIGLASARRDGRLGEKARVRLLGEMTGEVAAIVLEDNRLQALGLSIAEAPGPAATPSFIRVIEMLEERGHLDRKTEGLADSETLARRAADGHGLTRPEIAVLLSSAKLAVQEELEDSTLPDDPGLTGDLLAAFPPQMRRKFRRDILAHRLRREIIATRLANRMINRLGLVHPFELVEQEGATLAQVCAGFVAAERLFGMDAVWQAIETAEMPEPARILLFHRAAAALRPQIADLLRAGAGLAHPTDLVTGLKPGVDRLARRARELLGSEGRAASERLRGELTAAGAPAAEAGMVAHLCDMDGAVGLSGLARAIGVSATALTAAFIDLGTRLGLDWAQASAVRMNPSDTWERLLVAGLARDFQQMRLDFLRRTISRKADPAAAVGRWAGAQAQAIRQFRAMIARARASVAVSPAILAQLASQARNLLAR